MSGGSLPPGTWELHRLLCEEEQTRTTETYVEEGGLMRPLVDSFLGIVMTVRPISGAAVAAPVNQSIASEPICLPARATWTTV